MTGRLSGWDDTIVALATPPGVGAIGVIRLSGPQAYAIIDQLFPSRKPSAQPANTLLVGLLKHEGRQLDEVVLSLFRAPRSYTGEDVIEISAHGSPFVQQQIITACLQLGARLARPGEFTQRAFLKGKLDLAQAEAVADLIASNTDAARRTALHTMRGGFSQQLKQLRDQLIRFSALIELELDFSQEDVEFADRAALYTLVDELATATDRLIQSFRLGNVIKNGVTVAIVGKPNAGKSTLLNTLLNENRAIVSEIAGTTRDTIEEQLNIEGVLFRLIDTAGIREHTSDLIESIGIEKSQEKIRQADIVLYLFDANLETVESVTDQLQQIGKVARQVLAIANKIDLETEALLRQQYQAMEGLIFISARSGLYCEQLLSRLAALALQDGSLQEGTIITNARHQEALQQVAASLTDIRNGLDSLLPGDLLALDIRRCLHWLGEITGEITNEDQLDYIFSKFCIGK